MVAMARAEKEAFAQRANVAEIDDADADEEEEGEADEGAEAAEGNARARRRAAGSWRSRDISQNGEKRELFSPHELRKGDKEKRNGK